LALPWSLQLRPSSLPRSPPGCSRCSGWSSASGLLFRRLFFVDVSCMPMRHLRHLQIVATILKADLARTVAERAARSWRMSGGRLDRLVYDDSGGRSPMPAASLRDTRLRSSRVVSISLSPSDRAASFLARFGAPGLSRATPSEHLHRNDRASRLQPHSGLPVGYFPRPGVTHPA